MRLVFSSQQRKLIGAMIVPFVSIVLHMAMFTVAIPTIRADFALPADTASWLVIVYTLPYIIFMPFYGVWGDAVGNRRLLVAGGFCYVAGCGICLAAPDLRWLIVGRIVQAAGAASVNPLCLSIISERFEHGRRGKALGTWNSSGPFTAVIAPVLGGLIIDGFGWRAIYLPILAVGFASVFVVYRLIPRRTEPAHVHRTAKSFDWVGFALLGLTLTMWVFFLSSRPLTGYAPLRDWRLLLGAVAASVTFYAWERRRSSPFISFRLFRTPGFTLAAACVAVRMTMLGGVNFLFPLYVAEIHSLPASFTGVVVMIHAAALMITMRIGGHATDSWSSRWPVRIGLIGQSSAVLYLALFSGTPHLFVAAVGLVLHGSAAGFSLAALHHSALHRVPTQESGAAAGVYSMMRFSGSLVGAALAGVVLQHGLGSFEAATKAYAVAFAAVACVGLAGAGAAFGLRESRSARRHE